MQGQQKKSTTSKIVKEYLSKNEIPQLFECLMTGLMYHRPEDYIHYLQNCLKQIEKEGINAVHWDMFLEFTKAPLPPIAPSKKEFRPNPLPEIGSLSLKISSNSSFVIIQSGPGIGKSEICSKLSTTLEQFCHIKLGSLIRENAIIESKESNSKWKSVSNLINNGDFAPGNFVLEILIKELNKNSDKEHFLIEGFPRTVQQRLDFDKLIGINNIKFMVLVDCEANICRNLLTNRPPVDGWADDSKVAISKRIANYSSYTLVVCKFFHEMGKLKVIDGENSNEIIYKEVEDLFINECSGSSSAKSESKKNKRLTNSSTWSNDSSSDEDIFEIRDLVGVATEMERKSDLPQCSIMLLLGGPGSGKTDVAFHLCEKYTNWIHIDINELMESKVMNNEHFDKKIDMEDSEVEEVIDVEAVRSALKSISSTIRLIIIEGFPNNEKELNKMNTEIGRIDLIVLLDSEEQTMKARLLDRFLKYGFMEDEKRNVKRRIHYFKHCGLSISKYYDKLSRLHIVNADVDSLQIIENIEKVIPSSLKVSYNQSEISAAVRIQASIRRFLRRKLNKTDSLQKEKKSIINK